jgi:hypothetical protein
MQAKAKGLQALGAVAALITAFTRTAEAQTKVYPCAGANSYDQPNSFYAERVGTFGSQFEVDLVSKFTDINGAKWAQVKWFNGYPGQTGAGWKFGWVRTKDICK